jgi:hypothetical protein
MRCVSITNLKRMSRTDKPLSSATSGAGYAAAAMRKEFVYIKNIIIDFVLRP